MIIKQNLVSKSKYNIKCPYSLKPEYITVHNTDNTASAKDEVGYMIRNNKQISFHVAVDDIEAIQGIPFNRNAWAAGDGKNGTGNRKSIHVEICKNKLGANNITFKKCEDNAVKVCAQLLKQFNLGIDRLKPHKHWSGKNCPSTTNHQEFINRVKAELEKLNNPTSTKKYKNCILYSGEIDKAVATCMGFYYEDCIVKDIKDHVMWEGYNLYVIGGACNTFQSDEKFTKIFGPNRKETHEEMLKFINRAKKFN
ncbi:peptidoglycan recognition protein family protein [Faecalimicrobium sp. JNUCC 81]